MTVSKPLAVIDLQNARSTAWGGRRTLDLDPELALGKRLIERLRSFGYERFFLVLRLNPVPWGTRQDHETARAAFETLRQAEGVKGLVLEPEPGPDFTLRVVKALHGRCAEELPAEPNEPFLWLSTDSLFIPPQALEDMVRCHDGKNSFCTLKSPFTWEWPDVFTREVFRASAATRSSMFSEGITRLAAESPVKRSFFPAYIEFNVAAEFRAVFAELCRRPASEWTYDLLEELWKTRPELFRGTPRHIGVELTNDDNLPERLRSPRRVSKRPIAFLRPEDWRALVDALPLDYSAVSIDLCDFGEPLLHPQVFDFARLASDRGARVDLYTNGTLLDGEKIDRLLDCGLDAVFFRLDAATPETYGRVAGNAGLYGRAVDNLALLLEKKKARGGTEVPWRPIIAAQITEMPETAGDVDAFFDRYGHGQKIRDRIQKEQGRDAPAAEIWPLLYKASPPLEYAMLRHDNLYRGVIKRSGGMDVTPLRRFSCRHLRSGPFVLSSGDVVPCREDIEAAHRIGHVADGLMKIWSGEAMTRFHETHEKQLWKDHPLCGSCQEWYYSMR